MTTRLSLGGSSLTTCDNSIQGNGDLSMSGDELLAIAFYPYYGNLVEACECDVCERTPAHVFAHAAERGPSNCAFEDSDSEDSESEDIYANPFASAKGYVRCGGWDCRGGYCRKRGTYILPGNIPKIHYCREHAPSDYRSVVERTSAAPAPRPAAAPGGQTRAASGNRAHARAAPGGQTRAVSGGRGRARAVSGGRARAAFGRRGRTAPAAQPDPAAAQAELSVAEATATPGERSFAKLLAKFKAAKRYLSEQLPHLVSLYGNATAVEALYHFRFALGIEWPEFLNVRLCGLRRIPVLRDREVETASRVDYITQLLVQDLRSGRPVSAKNNRTASETVSYLMRRYTDVEHVVLDTRGTSMRTARAEPPACGIQFEEIEPEVV